MDAINPKVFTDPVAQILAGIHDLSIRDKTLWVSAANISNFLRDTHGIHIHWRSIDTTLSKNKAFVTRRKRKSSWQYMLLDGGRAVIAGADESISFIDPTTALQATLKLHDLLAGLIGTIKICDPYIDDSTIEHLEACPKNQPIYLLTMNVKDSGTLRRLVAAAKATSYQLQIRVLGSRILHDRYIIDDKTMFILGTSLNGFGKKQSFVIKTGPDIRELSTTYFDANWSAAQDWP